MRLKLHRWAVVVIGLLAFVTILFMWLLIAQSPECPNFKIVNKTEGCYLVSSQDGSYHMLGGQVVKKHSPTDDYLSFDFMTQDRDLNTVTTKISIPAKNVRVGLSTADVDEDGELLVSDLNQLVEPPQLFESFGEGDEIVVSILTPLDSDLESIIKELGDQPFIPCYNHNRLYIDNLHSPSFTAKLNLFKDSIKTGCDVVAIQITRYK